MIALMTKHVERGSSNVQFLASGAWNAGDGAGDIRCRRVHDGVPMTANPTGAVLESASSTVDLICNEVPGDGVNLLWPEVIGSIRGRYFLLTRQILDAQTAQEWGVVNEIVPRDQLLARAHEIARSIAELPPLTSSYTRTALTQRLRRVIDEGIGCGLALEGISAADVARRMPAQG
jgi:hypothetical protein